jgi:hypothetical protein
MIARSRVAGSHTVYGLRLKAPYRCMKRPSALSRRGSNTMLSSDQSHGVEPSRATTGFGSRWSNVRNLNDVCASGRQRGFLLTAFPDVVWHVVYAVRSHDLRRSLRMWPGSRERGRSSRHSTFPFGWLGSVALPFAQRRSSSPRREAQRIRQASNIRRDRGRIRVPRIHGLNAPRLRVRGERVPRRYAR